jgi:lycopene elongase/hydratase (dihydrobisanhydrobacterioruberin-forming)
MKLKDLYKISRPRFWLYYAGTYAVGFSLAATSIADFNTLFFVMLAFFTFPANFFIYGINDYFDWETDKLNPKKKTKEYLLKPENKKFLKYLLLIPVLLGLILSLLKPNIFYFMALFLLIGGYYSAPPIRFKARPYLDSISNLFYVIPGFMGYYQVTGNLPNIYIMLAAMIWSITMHLYSAVPDIAPDKKAKIKTTAIIFGRKNTLIICAIMWLISALLITKFSLVLAIIGLIYPLIALLSFKNVEKIYWAYPYVNASIGFILFWFGGLTWSGLF